ncbi:proline--tRNA ligase [Ktedonobacteria bacterium brp13]|nr:proline--tRNA ligase [Ktedonobacteria bacterium brp13]
MRVSQLLSTTLREAPRDVESVSQELLVRAGYIRLLTAGVYSFLPLGNRVMQKIAAIIREEMDGVGGQEVLLPVLQPEEIWQAQPADGRPSRADSVDILFHLEDRKGRALVLGPTHEEIATLLAQEFIRSYRDLPRLLYQIQVKMRDEPRPRGGLLRTREFLMKDLYSFDADSEGQDQSYRALSAAYQRIFERCGLRFIVAEADSGAIGGKDSQEFLALTDAGEDEALVCEQCGYAANLEKAEFVREILPTEPEGALTEVYTPDCTTILALADFLQIPASKTMKAVCYGTGIPANTAEDGDGQHERLILIAIRGDLAVNEVKLRNVLRTAGVAVSDLHLATPEELARAHIVAGFTSPVGKGDEVLVIIDESLHSGNNFVGGANRVDYHLTNINYPRDLRSDLWADIASAFEGATCVHCSGTMHTVNASEVGHIFKVGSHYSELFNASFHDAEGAAHPLLMGCYGIGLGRLMAVVAEQHHDEKGLVWPAAIAPYQLSLVGLDLTKGENGQLAEQLYKDLFVAGIEVLYDDRNESSGVKFNDADLLGLPLRAVLSKRSLKNGGIELKARADKESRIVPLSEAVTVIRAALQHPSAEENIRML